MRTREFFMTSRGLILGAIIFSGAIALAWNVPISAPPAGNASAPINVSSASQTKLGELIVGKLTSNGPIDVTNDKIINVATPTAPSDGVNKAYVDALSGVGGTNNASGGIMFAWGNTDKHFFLTASTYNGNLGGLSGADTKCNADANAVPGKTYHVVRENDSTWGAPLTGLYNNASWINSHVSIIPVAGSSGMPAVNNNYLGDRAMLILVPTFQKVVSAKDFGVRFGLSSIEAGYLPTNTWETDRNSNSCVNYTNGTNSSGLTVRGLVFLGDRMNNAVYGGISDGGEQSVVCSTKAHLLCAEN